MLADKDTSYQSSETHAVYRIKNSPISFLQKKLVFLRETYPWKFPKEQRGLCTVYFEVEMVDLLRSSLSQ